MESDYQSINHSLFNVNGICEELNQQTQELKQEIERLNLELSNEIKMSNQIQNKLTKRVKELELELYCKQPRWNYCLTIFQCFKYIYALNFNDKYKKLNITFLA